MWAMRRYLPVVIPGFLLAAVVVLAAVGRRGRAGRVAAAVLAASMFVVPLFVSHRLVRVRDGVPQVHGRRLFVLATSPNLVGADAAPAGGWPPISWVAVSHCNATLNRAVDTAGTDNRTMLPWLSH
jgi:hypothetical protein